MGCLSIQVTPLAPPKLTVETGEPPSLAVTPVPPTAAVAVTPEAPPVVVVTPKQQATLDVIPMSQAVLVIGEVCSVGDDDICVLAASDGPLLVQPYGGYILLNSENEE